MSLLGIDIGTTGCKTAAFSEAGLCLATAYREYPMVHPRKGWAELDSAGVWQCVKAAIGEVATKTSNDSVTALSVSSIGEAMTPVSADREILANSILCTDVRGSEYVNALKEEISQDDFFRINANIFGVHYSLPKLCWIRDHQPELWGQADKFLLWGDLIAYMLGGDPMTSFSHASRTLLFDIRRETWAPRLLEFSKIDDAKLPEPVPSGTAAGTVAASIASELGLGKGVKIIVGGHDQCCNALGAGIVTAGKAVCGVGTLECITPVYDHIPDAQAMLAGGLNVEHHVLPGLYVSFVFNQSGLLVRWFRDTFAAADAKLLTDASDIYDVLASEMPTEPTKLFTLPYFELTGPPEFVRDASGVITGLRTTTTRGEILKSIMESATYFLAEAIGPLKGLGIDTSEFVATGGGAKSDSWLQIKADIFGVPFVRPRITECAALGAAILAGSGTKRFTDHQQAVSQFVARDRVFEPDPHRRAIYAERLAQYRKLFPLLRQFLRETC